MARSTSVGLAIPEAVQVGAGLQGTDRVLGQAQVQVSLSSPGTPQPSCLRFRQEETEAKTAPSQPCLPSISTSSRMRSPRHWDPTLHWDPDSTHTSLTSRNGVGGALERKCHPEEQETRSNRAQRGNQEKQGACPYV